MITIRTAIIVFLCVAFSPAPLARSSLVTDAASKAALLPLRIPPLLYMAIYDDLHHPGRYPSRAPRTLNLPLAPGSARVLLKISAGNTDPDAAVAAARAKASAARDYLVSLGIAPDAVHPAKPAVVWFDYKEHKWCGYWATLFVSVIVPDFFDWPLFYDQAAKFGEINPGHSIIRTRGHR